MSCIYFSQLIVFLALKRVILVKLSYLYFYVVEYIRFAFMASRFYVMLRKDFLIP